jgi:hypothetical protein
LHFGENKDFVLLFLVCVRRSKIKHDLMKIYVYILEINL